MKMSPQQRNPQAASNEDNKISFNNRIRAWIEGVSNSREEQPLDAASNRSAQVLPGVGAYPDLNPLFANHQELLPSKDAARDKTALRTVHRRSTHEREDSLTHDSLTLLPRLKNHPTSAEKSHEKSLNKRRRLELQKDDKFLGSEHPLPSGPRSFGDEFSSEHHSLICDRFPKDENMPSYRLAEQIPLDETDYNIGKSRNEYERQPRRKTRIGKYDLKGGEVSSKRQRTKAVDTHRRTGSVLKFDFKPPNVTQNRLTMRAGQNLGIFSKGKASSPVKRRGLPDLSFPEMKFLSGHKTRHADPAPLATTEKAEGRVYRDQQDKFEERFARPLEARDHTKQDNSNSANNRLRSFSSPYKRTSTHWPQKGVLRDKPSQSTPPHGLSGTWRVTRAHDMSDQENVHPPSEFVAIGQRLPRNVESNTTERASRRASRSPPRQTLGDASEKLQRNFQEARRQPLRDITERYRMPSQGASRQPLGDITEKYLSLDDLGRMFRDRQAVEHDEGPECLEPVAEAAGGGIQTSIVEQKPPTYPFGGHVGMDLLLSEEPFQYAMPETSVGSRSNSRRENETGVLFKIREDTPSEDDTDRFQSLSVNYFGSGRETQAEGSYRNGDIENRPPNYDLQPQLESTSGLQFRDVRMSGPRRAAGWQVEAAQSTSARHARNSVWKQSADSQMENLSDRASLRRRQLSSFSSGLLGRESLQNMFDGERRGGGPGDVTTTAPRTAGISSLEQARREVNNELLAKGFWRRRRI